MITCDKFGFFNGIYGIEQSNWANYWKGIIPDGIIAGMENEMEIYTPTAGEGMSVRLKTGQAIVDNHRAWITAEKILPIETADENNPRIDLVVLRVVYGNKGLSRVYADVKTGTPAASPEAPGLIQVTGETYEISLAVVAVSAMETNIIPADITDLRHVFRIPYDTVDTFTGTVLTCKPDREYRNPTPISSLTVTLPQYPQETFITSVVFTSSAAFTEVTVKHGLTTISGTDNLKLKGDALTLPSRRYTVVFYWDGQNYWAVSAAVTA